MKGIRVGYIRVSAEDQNIDRQLADVTLDKKFIEKVSGKDTNRPEFQRMLEYIREGDTLVVHSMDRLARNLDDLRQTVQSLVKKGIHVQFVKENLLFTGDDSPISMLTLSIMGAFAEFERSIIKERQREGIEIAKKKGRYRRVGRGKALKKEQVEELMTRVAKGEPKLFLARYFHLSPKTIYNYIGKVKEA